MLWLVWLVIAMAALVGELLTSGLFLATFAVAALVTTALALTVALPVQVGAFGALSILLLIFVRPAALRFLPAAPTVEPLPRPGPIGQHAIAVEPIDQRRGQIRLGTTEFWSARTEEGVSIPSGSEVRVVGVRGLMALVEPTTTPVSQSESGAPFGLSPREIEVLQLVALGMSNQEIADRLYLSPRTVHHHVSHILDKMGAGSRLEAVRRAMDAGIIRLDGS